MFEELKRITTKNALTRVAGSLVIMIILLAVFSSSIMKLVKGPVKLDSLPANKLDSTYVKSDVNNIIGAFAEYYVENDNGTKDVTKNYYIIPMGDHFIGLEVDSKSFDKAEQIYNETYEYYNHERDELTTAMTVTGTINKMDDDVYRYYEDWFKTSGIWENPTHEDIEQIALPYILQMDYIGGQEDFIIYAVLAISGLLLLYAIVVLVKAFTGLYLAPIRKYLNQGFNTVSEEHLEADYQNGYSVGKVRVGKDFIYFFKGNKACLLNNADIIWVYLEEVTHRVNGIKSGVTKSLILYTKNKKKHSIAMRNSSQVNTVLDIYSQSQPHMVVGFTEELKTCFKKDFDTFMRIPHMRKAEAEQNQNEDMEY